MLDAINEEPWLAVDSCFVLMLGSVVRAYVPVLFSLTSRSRSHPPRLDIAASMDILQWAQAEFSALPTILPL